MSQIDHWSIKVYSSGREKETIRNINTVSKDTIMQVFEREGIKAQAMPYDSSGSFINGESESVNWR